MSRAGMAGHDRRGLTRPAAITPTTPRPSRSGALQKGRLPPPAEGGAECAVNPRGEEAREDLCRKPGATGERIPAQSVGALL